MPRRPRRTYDHVWRKLRLKILERDGYRCWSPGCDRPATRVDHVVPVAEAPHLRLEPANLRASCTKHNEGRVMPRLAAMAKVNRSTARVRDW